MKKIVIQFFSGWIAGTILSIVGLLIGAFVSSNNESFVFGGAQGYEAGGVIGAAIGLVLGNALVIKIIDRRIKNGVLVFLSAVVALIVDLAFYAATMSVIMSVVFWLLPTILIILGANMHRFFIPKPA